MKVASVRLESIVKHFGDILAVDHLSIEVEEGEFFSLLGPSGCGKTTTLRMIAGFEAPDSGKIFFGKKDVTNLKPQQRNAGMVFQNYALFPHMTVGENVAFGLRARNIEKSAINSKVANALQLVDLAGYEKRQVNALSGGQQQRVALARALVIEPDILLLDEPLSNLDAKLRVETREQIRSLQQRLGITTFYVTHDQEEALSQSDRMAVLIRGRCVQVGAPREVYREPANREVMAFLGKANFLRTAIEHSENGMIDLRISDNWRLKLPAPNILTGNEVLIGFRPHDVLIQNIAVNSTTQAKVIDIVYTGAYEEVLLKHDAQVFSVQRTSGVHNTPLKKGDSILFQVPADAVRIFSLPTGHSE
jgi:iron(III) transport system ATP-binding protein